MTLLSPLALLVGLTALVPLILHLYQQRRRTVIEFSTNRFFTKSIVRAQRRLRLRRLILLLVRMAACLLLALALARPLWTLAGFGGREGKRDVVVLLDDSFSMQALFAGPGVRRQGPGAANSAAEPNRFERARELALELLRGLTTGDQAAVVTFTGRATGEVTHAGLELSGDLLHITDEVGRWQSTYAAGDAHTALARAAALLTEASARDRLVVVLSDLQAGDWRQADWPQPAQPASLAIVPLPGRADRGAAWDNLVADQLLLSQGTAVVGQPNLLQVRLVNYARRTVAAELVLDVDGREQVRRPLELGGQDRRIEQIPLVFDTPGEHRVVVRVETEPNASAGGTAGTPRLRSGQAQPGRYGPEAAHPADALAADNTLHAIVRVSARLPVLIVDGHADASAGSRSPTAAFFVQTALRASGQDGDQSMEVNTIRPDDLNAAALEDCRVAVLSEVSRLSVAQVELLERFVETGSGLAIFPGEAVDRAFYNEILGAASRPLGGLLPAEIGPLVEAGETALPSHVLAAELEHPALQRFQGTLRGALAGFSVYRAYALQPRDAWILAVMEAPGRPTPDAGLPLLVERAVGRGRVILCAAPPNPRWTNLPLRRAFVPLCSRLVSYLAGGGAAPVEHAVGNDLELLRGGWDPDSPLYITRPDGARVRAAVRVVDAEPIAYVPAEKVELPGFYVLEGSDEAIPRPRSGQGPPQNHEASALLAVNVPRRESTPEVLDLDEAKKLAGNWRVEVVEPDAAGMDGVSPAATRSLLAGGRISRGAWDTLLWMIFVLLLAEPLLANQIVRFRAARASNMDRAHTAQRRAR